MTDKQITLIGLTRMLSWLNKLHHDEPFFGLCLLNEDVNYHSGVHFVHVNSYMEKNKPKGLTTYGSFWWSPSDIPPR